MINAWSLLYDEIYGDDEMSPCKTDHIDVFTVGSGNTASADNNYTYSVDTTNFADIKIDPSALDNEGIAISGGDSAINFDDITFIESEIGVSTASGDYDTVTLNIPIDNEIPLPQSFLADNDDAAAHHFTTPSGIEDRTTIRKYKEDESIEALRNYISTTYGGHYTSDTNDVQTLDLIESVGDAEAFCRSNAIKYLSRYDKKGQAKRDIHKALHYSLLLYHFSGQLNETPTRGYETF